ncbi:PQQ-dependent sugar dehydrogenase [Microbacterium immunditiarum]|uniref:Glucose/arabinose dehydrogenase n=1 Tax=Microbacterium immunditiarum TaxID=337480 RepID=A0A7Y9GS36_9MICO|nr:PQQ-dependent sugar dehydrogenase [Microbacterium immunditiarum]NYE20570.1 glucose/arabinose dehydrogenase [Microbacterium immunditiarum]
MTRVRRALAAVVVAALVGAASACTSSAPPQPVPPPASRTPVPSASPTAPETAEGWWAPQGAPETLATGLRSPWSVVPLETGGALISQRDDGRIIELMPSGELREAGVVPGVVAGGEAGLHGLALHDEGGTRWLYAYHGASDDNRVVRMPVTGDPGALALGAPEVVFAGIARAGNHNGGRIAFGPDDMLYVTTGDAANGDSSQDPNSPNGKILRLTPDGDAAPGNPLGNAVWSLGHRNVQGIAWTADGTMWASEFGQNSWDELNLIEPGGNYGWPIVEGVGGDGRFVEPIATWRTSEASPSGIASVGDTVFVAGLRGSRLWIVDTVAGAAAHDPTAALVGEQGRLRDVVAAPDGSLWVLTNNTDGRGSPRPEDDLLLRLPIAPAG